jgi:hypothetical protein
MGRLVNANNLMVLYECSHTVIYSRIDMKYTLFDPTCNRNTGRECFQGALSDLHVQWSFIMTVQLIYASEKKLSVHGPFLSDEEHEFTNPKREARFPSSCFDPRLSKHIWKTVTTTTAA